MKLTICKKKDKFVWKVVSMKKKNKAFKGNKIDTDNVKGEVIIFKISVSYNR